MHTGLYMVISKNRYYRSKYPTKPVLLRTSISAMYKIDKELMNTPAIVDTRQIASTGPNFPTMCILIRVVSGKVYRYATLIRTPSEKNLSFLH